MVLSPWLQKLFNTAIAVNLMAFEDKDWESGRMMIPFSSECKAMGVVVWLQSGSYRLYIKGASKILMKQCTDHIVVSRDGTWTTDESDGIAVNEIDTSQWENISCTTIFCVNQTLRTIAICYHNFASWPPAGIEAADHKEVPFERMLGQLILIGIIGIEDPLHEAKNLTSSSAMVQELPSIYRNGLVSNPMACGTWGAGYNRG
ncbi:P-type ATPase [Pisolithus marmoratus]|nr:P-type ATPase [Pisolithus marmoratus]